MNSTTLRPSSDRGTPSSTVSRTASAEVGTLVPGGLDHLAGIDPELAARVLEAHADYRVQRRLRPRTPVGRRPLKAGERVVIVLDTETTGLDPGRDEVIELGMLSIVHDTDGTVVDVLDVFDARREPTVPVPPEVTRLTGIAPDMLVGKTIAAGDVERFLSDASLVICHNAAFDRPFCERLNPAFAELPWACTDREVDWPALGYDGRKLTYLIGRLGWFYSAHRALDDCHALVELLASAGDAGGTVLFGLLAASSRTRFRIWAEQAPFEARARLKGRRYRWSDGSDGRPRCWWTEVGQDKLEDELEFLRTDIYGWDASPRVQRLTALERYRSG